MSSITAVTYGAGNGAVSRVDDVRGEATVAAGGSSADVKLRLTKRGKIVVSALAAATLAGVFVAGVNLTSASAESDLAQSQQEFEYVVMQPGSTLWDVATQLDKQSDPRDLVAEIVQLNQLEGSGVQAGQPVAVPLRYNGKSWLQTADELGL